jgi:hypothetical protein
MSSNSSERREFNDRSKLNFEGIENEKTRIAPHAAYYSTQDQKRYIKSQHSDVSLPYCNILHLVPQSFSPILLLECLSF